MSKKVAVILSGCGYQDGSEITETISVLIALGEVGADIRIFAPDRELAVNDHLRSEPSGEHRNVLSEAARLARGKISDLKTLRASEFDALAIPGGYGVAKNLCTWATAGSACTVEPDVERVLNEFYEEKRPILAVCIAPALVARVLGKKGVTLTIGDDAGTAGEIEKTGAIHEKCTVEDYVTDREHRVISTPAYMYDDAKPFQVFKGIRGAVRELVEMA